MGTLPGQFLASMEDAMRWKDLFFIGFMATAFLGLCAINTDAYSFVWLTFCSGIFTFGAMVAAIIESLDL